MLADPAAIPASDPRSELAGSLTTIRDAMLANPELVAGRHDRIDTSLMKAAPGRLVSKGGMEALRGDRDPARRPERHEHGRGLRHGHQDRGRRWLRPRDVGGDGRGAPAGRRRSTAPSLRDLARYHRPAVLDPHGRVVAETVPEFELAPVGELIG